MRFALSKDIENIEMDDVITLFEPETGDTHIIDEVGKEVLDLCAKMDVEDAIRRLAEIYDETEEVIGEDVLDFLNELAAKGLAKIE